MKDRVLHLDHDVLILDKPAGLLVHPGPRGQGSLSDFLPDLWLEMARPPALAHRLDRDTSGCLVLGRHQKALMKLGRLFSRGLVDKVYWAIVRGVPLPVVSASRLLGGAATAAPGRFVTLRAGERHVVLAVDGVVGVRRVSSASVRELPPLLRDAASDVVAKIGALDARLLLVLRTMHLVPESLVRSLAAMEAS